MYPGGFNDTVIRTCENCERQGECQQSYVDLLICMAKKYMWEGWDENNESN